MDFTPPSEADVDMAIHEDALLDINLAAQYAPGTPHGSLMGNTLADAFIAGMIPGVTPMANHQQHHPAQQSNQMQQQQQPQQNFSSVEEYAALMGIKLENNQEDQSMGGHMQQQQMNGFNVQGTADPAKIQANAAYFENLYRERVGNMGADNVTSMTLPAGVGSGMGGANMFMNPAATPTHHGSGGVYDRPAEIQFNHMNNRVYDPNAGFAANPAAPMQMHKPATHRMVQHHAHDMGAQTLSPEILSAMIKNNNQSMHNFDNLSEDERAALLKEEKSRERNRDHSRKSRLRKKEYVESLKQEVEQLRIYQQICEHNPDLIALVTSEPKAILLYTSGSHGRVLGFQNHHLVPGQTSFLDLVHPDHVPEVRNVFQKLCNVGDSKRFQFRIKSVDGEYYNAETSARVADKGVVCSTRVDRDV
ncbi:hypothetical protein Poli38472_008188 [Pythium oligandrum]|uniref:PAS fold-3 domain-containing protein n=1 Tax=Pythium oligandrum TaxID=41045 RepID=A0A8K1CMV1_PYTOL|nr:hypothetical protein Poli38472_008188 [Pythium oligandrum]|eukprot:TMW65546.1 hypothetical protein Poli38472_008188 [Pythium oligandrum]